MRLTLEAERLGVVASDKLKPQWRGKTRGSGVILSELHTFLGLAGSLTGAAVTPRNFDSESKEAISQLQHLRPRPASTYSIHHSRPPFGPPSRLIHPN